MAGTFFINALTPNYFREKKEFSSGIAEEFNNKIKLTIKKIVWIWTQ